MRLCSLIELLADKSDLVGCELGVAWGENAAIMLERLKIKLLHLIDPYQPYYDSTQGAGGLLERPFEDAKKIAYELLKEKQVSWINKQSWDAVKEFEDNSLDFVYIDASHQYESVSTDIKDWLPKVKPGGILAGHDYAIDDIKKALADNLEGFQVWEKDNNEWFYIK